MHLMKCEYKWVIVAASGKPVQIFKIVTRMKQ